ncbi:MAG: hypothetical protein A2309_14650 [Bacteroidetes bacterium RIFOXYB2_FULL_35_7]|nr:MAG: hypothetical protein A2309_14650 [Bacteroidetes bacterium RIFOXYB2_FULL_35_7]
MTKWTFYQKSQKQVFREDTVNIFDSVYWDNNIRHFYKYNYHVTEEFKGFPYDPVIKIVEDKIGNIWFQCNNVYGSNVIGNNNGRFYVLNYFNSGISNVFDVACDSSNLWLTHNNMLFKYTNNIANNTGLIGLSNYNRLTVANNGKLYVTNSSFIKQYYNGSCTDIPGPTNFIPPDNFFTTSDILSICSDNNNNLWVWAYLSSMQMMEMVLSKYSNGNWANEYPSINNTLYKSHFSNVMYFSGSLQEYNGSGWTEYTTPSGNISSITKDSTGRFWIGTANNEGVFVKNGSIWNNYNYQNSALPEAKVKYIFTDYSNQVHVATDSGLYVFNGSNFDAFYPAINGLFNDDAHFATFDPQNKLWIGSLNSFSHQNNNGWKNFTSKMNNNVQVIKDIAFAQNGTAWMQGAWSNLISYDGTNLTVYTPDDSTLLMSDSKTICIDHEDNVWLASKNNGVVKFDGANWHYFNGTTTPVLNLVKPSDMLSKDSAIWMISQSGRLYRYQSNEWSTLTFLPLTWPTYIYPLMDIDKRGNIWVTTVNNGLAEYNTTTDVWTYHQPSTNLKFLKIAIDKYGNKWAAGDTFLTRYDGYQWKYFFKNNSPIPKAYISSLQNKCINDTVNIVAAYLYEGVITLNTGISRVEATLRGNVKLNSAPVDHGYVLLYKKTANSISIPVDSVTISSNGNFLFTKIDTGLYYIHAFPSSDYFPETFPTYYGDQCYWADATPVYIDYTELYDSLDINIVSPSFQTGANYLSGKIISAGSSSPVTNADVLLKLVPDSIIRLTCTNDTGYYVFENIPQGQYNILVDIPCLPMDSVYFVDFSSKLVCDNLDYFVSDTSIFIDNTTSLKNNKNDFLFKIFPNPASGHINFISDKVPDRIIIYDMMGRVVFLSREKIVSGRINTECFSKGIYLMKVRTGESEQKYKFEKE